VDKTGATAWLVDTGDTGKNTPHCFRADSSGVRPCGPKYSSKVVGHSLPFEGGSWFVDGFYGNSISLARSNVGAKSKPQEFLSLSKGEADYNVKLTQSGRLLVATAAEIFLLDPTPPKLTIRTLFKWKLKAAPDLDSDNPFVRVVGVKIWVKPPDQDGVLVFDVASDNFDKTQALRLGGKTVKGIYAEPEGGVVWVEGVDGSIYAMNQGGDQLGSAALPHGLDQARFVPAQHVLWIISDGQGVFGVSSDGQLLGNGQPLLSQVRFGGRAIAVNDALAVASAGNGVYVVRREVNSISSSEVLSEVRGTTMVSEPERFQIWLAGVPSNGDNTGIYLMDISKTPVYAERIAKGTLRARQLPTIATRDPARALLSIPRSSLPRSPSDIYVLGCAKDIDVASVETSGGSLNISTKGEASFSGSIFDSDVNIKLHWAGAPLIRDFANHTVSLQILDGDNSINQEALYPLSSTVKNGAVAANVRAHFSPMEGKRLEWNKRYAVRLNYRDPVGLQMSVSWPNVIFHAIEPPFYQARWFRTVALALFLGAVGFLLFAVLHERRVARRWVAVGTGLFGLFGTGVVSFVDKTLNVNLLGLGGLLTAEMLVACAIGVVSMPVFRELLEIAPFDWILGISLQWPFVRRRFYRNYVNGLSAWIANGRREAHQEQYASPPVLFQANGAPDIGGREPAEFIAEVMTTVGADPISVYISAPGGLGKSALLRRVVELAIAAWEDNPDLPLPLICAGDRATIMDEFANRSSLNEALVSVEYHQERMRQGEFFMVLDGLSEAPLTPKALGEHLRSKFSKGGAILTSRPDRAFENVVRASPRWLLAEPQPLKDVSLRKFVEKYSPPDSDVVDRLVAMVSPLKAADGTYSPILVRLCLIASPGGGALVATNLASVYHEALRKLLEKVESDCNLFSQAASMCVDTYWADASRTLAYANAPDARAQVLKRLKDAGIVVPLSGSPFRESEPTLVRFFHDSIQSFLTARGLFQQTSWDVFQRAASRPEFTDQKSELFNMCVEVFEPKTKVVAVLVADLHLSASSRSIKRIAEQEIVDALPQPLRPKLAQVAGGSGDVLRAAVVACAGSLSNLAEFYGAIVGRLVQAAAGEAAAQASSVRSDSGQSSQPTQARDIASA